MKVVSGALAALLVADQVAVGFVPLHRPSRARNRLAAVGMAEEATGVDVSIPYDAAARLAYDEWRSQYDKGEFDEQRFNIFKTNYETVTVANVVAKKKAREDATVSLSLMSLNEFGDMTAEEYQSMQEGGPPPTRITTGDVLGSAVKAAELQTKASNALEEASDALAIEEQKLVDALGLESVEELEVALDSMEGIAPDGGELETSNIAREARVRDAYLNWCKQFGREPSEPRYEAFSQNFLFMEQFEKGTGKEMTLNKYADYTKEEYEAMQKENAEAKAPEPKVTSAKEEPKAKAPETKDAPPKEEPKVKAAPQPKAEVKPPVTPQRPEAPKKSTPTPQGEPIVSEELIEDLGKNLVGIFGKAADIAQAATKGIRDSIQQGLDELDERASAESALKEMGGKHETEGDDGETKKTKEIAELAALREVRMAETAKRAADAEKAVEEARQQRMKQMAEKAKLEAARRKEIEKERADREKKAAVALQKAQAEAEQAAIAAAKEEQEKQATFAAQRAYFDQQAAEEARQKAREFEESRRRLEEERRKTVQPKKAPVPNVLKNLGSFSQGLGTAAPQTKKVQPKKATRPPAPKVAPKKQPAKKPVLKKAPVMKAPAKKAASSPTLSLFGSPTKKAKSAPSSPTLSIFGPKTPKSAVPKKTVPKKSAPARSSSTFSLFGPPPKKDDAVPPSPVPAPAAKKQAPAFSLFGSPPKKSAPAPPAVAPTPVVKKAAPAPAFSFFNPPAKKAAPSPTPAVAQPPAPKKLTRSPSFSLFGGSTAKKVEPAPAPAPVTKSAPAPSFSLFGSAPKAMKQANQPAAEPKVPNQQGTLSLFGGIGAAQKEKKEPSIPNRSGTISLFGANGAKKASAPKGATLKKQPSSRGFFGAGPSTMSLSPKTVSKKVESAPKSAPAKKAFSLFGSKPQSNAMATAKAVAPKGVPTLSRWRQNPDGSITGNVSGSPNFKAGTEITTSPVRKGATNGSLVKTGSGSKYFLS